MSRAHDRTTVAVVRAAAVGLALAAALAISQAAQTNEPDRRAVPIFFRALAVTAPLQIGLFWSATATRWSRLWAGLLMVPSALLLGGLVGEVIGRVMRGFPLKGLPTTTWIVGALVYLWRFYALAFPRKGRAA